jgi:hypothetical protein
MLCSNHSVYTAFESQVGITSGHGLYLQSVAAGQLGFRASGLVLCWIHLGALKTGHCTCVCIVDLFMLFACLACTGLLSVAAVVGFSRLHWLAFHAGNAIP